MPLHNAYGIISFLAESRSEMPSKEKNTYYKHWGYIVYIVKAALGIVCPTYVQVCISNALSVDIELIVS